METNTTPTCEDTEMSTRKRKRTSILSVSGITNKSECSEDGSTEIEDSEGDLGELIDEIITDKFGSQFVEISKQWLNQTAPAIFQQMVAEKLNQLMDLQERFLNREAKEQYARDFVAMKVKLPVVIKTKVNKQTQSKYAALETINKSIDSILSEFGFGTQTKVISQTEAGVTVEATLLHKGGHSESNSIFMPLDNKGMAGTVNKTLPHAVASSVTYAKRVAICALLNISTGDDEDGNQFDNFITLEQAIELDNLITELKFNEEQKLQFLSFMSAENVRNILAKDFFKAKNLLLSKKVKKEAGNANS